VLTPAEADEMLGMLRALTRQGRLTVLMITHKLREVEAFADAVTVLRNRGAAVLLVSEDLDELFELADRIVVMCNGRIVYATAVQTADLATVGYYMVAHGGEDPADASRRRSLAPAPDPSI
jgi:ABC-type uncharacterized transport system ATPase subunit